MLLTELKEELQKVLQDNRYSSFFVMQTR